MNEKPKGVLTRMLASIKGSVPSELTPEEEAVQDGIDELPDNVVVILEGHSRRNLDAQFEMDREKQERANEERLRARAKEIAALVVKDMKKLLDADRVTLCDEVYRRMYAEWVASLPERQRPIPDAPRRPWYRRLFKWLFNW